MELALSRHDHKTVKRLSKDKKILRQTFFNGQTALHVACDHGDAVTVKILLKQKADPNHKDDSQQTPLHIACKQAKLDVISLLLHYKANVMSPCIQGNTPLHFLVGYKATSQISSSIYSTLADMKEAGANLNYRNQHGNTPLHYACLKRCEKNGMWLIRNGADVTICNNVSDTPLHIAARFTSESFVSLLISAGASLTAKTCENLTPKQVAEKANRTAIVKLFDVAEAQPAQLSGLSNQDSIVLNGSEITVEQLNHFKQLLLPDTVRTKKVPRLTRSLSKSNVSEGTLALNNVSDKRQQARLMLTCVEMNCLLFSTSNCKNWWGFIRYPAEKDWVRKYSCIETDKISVFEGEAELVDTISLEGVCSFRVYADNPSRFSILYYSKDPIHLGAKPPEVNTILGTLVTNTRKPVEFIDQHPLLSLCEDLTCKVSTRRRSKTPVKHRKSLTHTISLIPSLNSSPLSLKRKDSNSERSLVLQNPPISRLTESGTIICRSDFTDFPFGLVFSSDVVMKEDADNRFIFSAGTLEDILNYLILHSGVSVFAGNTEIDAFYLSYYRYWEPVDIISALESIWEIHSSTSWPAPYNEVASDTRLYNFLKGFINSTFVLTDSTREINFRQELAELHCMLVPKPTDKDKTSATLKNIVQCVLRSMNKLAINQLCDLNSLLTSSESAIHLDFDLGTYDEDTVASQIVSITADLYGQLQIAEFLDLRYQKDKEFSVALNKVHEFSNKIYLLVPSTILKSDSSTVQKRTLRKWIVIAEKIFQLRDYNSTIQIINGITEISIMRLPHLKGSLSQKWIHRFDKLREAFDAVDSYAMYRNLPKHPPCIPFLGVALKDLVFAYEGNPDRENHAINFQKMRLIAEIVRSLKIGDASQLDYSFLSFDPRVGKALLNATPLTQDELYARSLQVSEIISIANSPRAEFDDSDELDS